MTKSCENCWHYDMPDYFCQKRCIDCLSRNFKACEEHNEMTEEEVEERDYGLSE